MGPNLTFSIKSLVRSNLEKSRIELAASGVSVRSAAQVKTGLVTSPRSFSSPGGGAGGGAATPAPPPPPPSLQSLVQASNQRPLPQQLQQDKGHHTFSPLASPTRPSDAELLSSRIFTAEGVVVDSSSAGGSFQPPSTPFLLSPKQLVASLSLTALPASSPLCSECGTLAVLRCHECSEDQCLEHFKALHKGGRRADHLWTAFHPTGDVEGGGVLVGTRDSAPTSTTTSTSKQQQRQQATNSVQSVNAPPTSKGNGAKSRAGNSTGFAALRSAWSSSNAPLSLSPPSKSSLSALLPPSTQVPDVTARQSAASEAFVRRLAKKF